MSVMIVSDYTINNVVRGLIAYGLTDKDNADVHGLLLHKLNVLEFVELYADRHDPGAWDSFTFDGDEMLDSVDSKLVVLKSAHALSYNTANPTRDGDAGLDRLAELVDRLEADIRLEVEPPVINGRTDWDGLPAYKVTPWG